MALTIWATRNGVAVSNGPIFTALSGEIVMTELGQFSHGTVTCPGADARVIAAMPEFTELEIHQDGLGKIGDGYVVNPRQMVDEQDNHTVTFDLASLTLECTWDRTLPEWEVDGALSVVYSRLAGLVIPQGGAPQWQFNFIGAGTAADIQVKVNHNNPTPLKAVLDTAKQFDQFVRQGVDAFGAPTRILEIGQFGAAPTQWLTSANGADPDAMATNDLVKVVATIEREPNNAIDLVNVVAPYGGGQDIASMVTLERLWRIINDPGYVNYGRYGTNDESRARTGKDSVFPEYDGVNYPISDPRNPPTGNWVYIFPATGATVSPSAGNTIAQIVAAGGVLHQGPSGTRRFTTAGRGVYFVFDAASYAEHGHKATKEFIDSSITYGNDTSVANQETIARALYVETTTNFKRFAHPHHTFTCTVENDIGRPTRAGDLMATDVQRISAGLDGAVQEMNVLENLRVMKWVRTFNGDAPPVGTITLSNLGRFDQDDATAAADQAATLIALQRRQDTGLAPYPLVFAGNVDALHPLTIWVLVPDELFRWHRFRMRVDFLPFTGTSTTAVNQTGTQIITVGGVDILLPTPSDVAIAGGNYNGTGFVSDTNTIGGMPLHFHKLDIVQGSHVAPTSASNWLGVYVGGTSRMLQANADSSGFFETSNQILRPDLSNTAHPHTTRMEKTIRTAGSTIAHIPAGTHLADLPLHTHPVDQRIPDGPQAPNVTVTMNGQSLSSGLALTSGSRNADGTFPGSFSVSDMSNMANAIKGDFPLVFTPGTSAGNGFGIGRFQVTLMGFGEFGGLASTFTG